MSVASKGIEPGEQAALLARLKELPPAERAALIRKLQAGGEKPVVEAIPRLPPGAPRPPSHAQEGLWLLERLAPGEAVYNMPVAVRLRGALDRAALARALGEVVRRQEALRATFGEEGGHPVLAITPPSPEPWPLPRIDLSGLAAEAREREAGRIAAATAARPLDLARGPLLVTRLVELGAAEHLLLLVVHHIVSDFWSMGVLVGEVQALYAGEKLPELPIQYADYAAWQRGWLSGEALERQLDYWRGQLADLPVLELPVDRRRPAFPTSRGGRLPVEVPAPVVEQLRELGRGQGATLFMGLLAGFLALLARHAGADDLAVSTAIANRNRPELQGLIGFFVNMLVLRVPVVPEGTFRELLARARQVTLKAYANQDLPFERLVAELKPSRAAGQAPLAQVACQLQNAPLPGVALPGLELTSQAVDNQTAKFDLSLSMSEGGGGALEYSAELFDEATMVRWARHFARLLAAAVEDPDARIAELPLLPEGERRQLLFEWNRTGVDWGPPVPLHQRFTELARARPDADAVVAPGIRVSYAELDRQADRLAEALRTKGVGIEARVGLLLERIPEQAVAILAVMKAGGAFVPLDPDYPAERLAFMVADAAPRVLLSRERHRELAAEIAGQVPVIALDGEPASPAAPAGPLPAVPLAATAYAIYTSGSTGQPKGVEITHGNLFALIHSMAEAWDLRRPRRILQFASPSFDAAVEEFWNALAFGGAVVYGAAGKGSTFHELAQVIRELEVDAATLPPSVVELLDPADFPGLETLIVAGEACSAELAARWSRGRRMWNGYGPSECTVCATTALLAPSPLPPSIGRPIGNVRVYAVGLGGEPVPVGIPGELLIGGPGVGRGYSHRPDLTAERFLPDPFGPSGGRLYRSGDRVRYRPSGELEFLGRLDHQVKLRGFRIELGEIEAALRRNPAVREAVVLVREDAPGDRRLVGYVTERDPKDIREKEGEGAESPEDLARRLRAELSAELPAYMVPAVVMVLERLPMTPNGKLDRAGLPVPEGGREMPGVAGFVAPPSPMEELVAGIWAEALGLAGASAVGVEADFFEDLGGHSLLAMQVISAVRDRLKVELPLRALFEARSVRGFVRRIEEEAVGAGEEVAPPRRRARVGAPPLSFAQERLWFLDQLSPGLSTYNVPSALVLKGALDVPALSRALSGLAARHETLRTHVGVAAGRPVQVIEPAGAVPLPGIDLSALPEPRAEAFRLASAEAARPFDLARGPLLRAGLVKLGPDEHLLLLNLHHIICDGWSTGVMVSDLAALYAGAALPELPLQYADYALWQRERLSGATLERQLAHFREALSGLEPLELPTDRRRPAVPRRRGGRVGVELPGEALKPMLREAGATPFMALLAGFAALLSRWSGQDDFAVGTAAANRGFPELFGLIGFFVNTLVLRMGLGSSPSFLELLARVREVTLSAYAHQELPFEQLVNELQPARDARENPLVQVMFLLQNAPVPHLDLPGLEIEGAGSPGGGSAKFDLTVLLAEAGAAVVGTVDYDFDLFDEATALRLARSFRRLLTSATVDPRRAVADLSLLSKKERQEILAAGQGEAIDAAETGPARPLHHLFEEQARRTPGALAMVDGALRLSYAELDERAARLAAYLAGQGVGPEERVGLCLDRGADLVIGILATWKAGGAYVPLDPAYPAERLAFMIGDAKPRVVLTHERHLALAVGAPALALDTEEGWLDGEGASAGGASEDGAQLSERQRVYEHRPEPPRPTLARGSAGLPLTPDNAAYLIYTSGSTGRPKGTVVAHRSAFSLTHALARRWDLARPRRVLQFASPSFDASVAELTAALAWGGTVVSYSGGRRLEAHELAALVAEHAADFAILPPSVLAVLEPASFPSLATVVAAGEAFPGEVAARWAPGRQMWNGYGPTESTVFATAFLCDGVGEPPIGRPIGNLSAHVLDPRLAPLPYGVPGELYLGGAGVVRGYLGRPELSAERFVPDPFGATGGRLYRTGDRARLLPSGEIEYLGRLDHQVKLRGFRIELGEIEAALRQSPEVRDAVVLLREDHPGDKRLVGYLVAREGAGEGLVARLRAGLAGRLPEYMVPSAWVILERMPLSPNGKLDRKALPLPETAAPAGEDAPATPFEEILAGLFAEVLGLPRVGVEDDFFADLGGHSLLATQVLVRARAVLGLELPLRALFEAPTVRGFAQVAAEEARAGLGLAGAELAPRGDAGSAPLSYAQERLWFLEQLTPGLGVYNVPLAVSLEGALDLPALAGALAGLAARHEVLRARIEGRGGRPVQVFDPPGEAPTAPGGAHKLAGAQTIALRPRSSAPPLPTLPLIDLSRLDQGSRQRTAYALAGLEAGLPFDLERGPLWRARLLRLVGEEHVLLLTLHHIVSDGWSLGILIEELGALYAGRELAPLPLQYADYAVWQRRQLSGEVLDRQLAYFRERLAGLEPLQLPADRRRPAVRSHRGGFVAAELPAALGEALARLSRESGVTLFMTLLAGFAAVLSRWSGQEDLAVGTAVANRTRRELFGLIGFFVNTLVLRASLAGRPSFAGLLAQVREETLGAYGHQDVPFERLVEELKPVRDTSQNPLVQVLLVLQNAPVGGIDLPGLSLGRLGVENQTAKFDLTLSLSERADGGVGGSLEYDADLFDPATAERLARHLRRFLESAVATPEGAVGELALLDDAERRQVVEGWNDTAAVLGPERRLPELLEERIAERPDAVAITSDTLRLSYSELGRRSAEIARRLQGLGVGPERFVGVCLERSADMVVALVGVMRAGGAYVPLDPDLPPARILALAEDADLAAVIVEAGSEALLAGSGRPLLRVEERSDRSDDSPALESGAVPANALYAIYTSGSTGMPKGVVNAHPGVVNRLRWIASYAGLAPGDRVLQKTPFSFDVSVWELFWPLVEGAELVMARAGGHRDPDYLAELIARERVTITHFVPSMLEAFLAARGMARCPGLTRVFLSGEALTEELERRFFDQSSAGLWNLYGPTEAAIEVTWWVSDPAGKAKVAIGRPIANAKVYVLDPEGAPAPVGVPGEFYLGGLPVARGYLGRPGLTAERFVPDPFADGARLYKTGDRARWRPDGAVEYLGRLDHQVKLRGFRIEPGEVEAVLTGHPGVRDAVVVLREDSPGDKRLVAYVVPAPAADAAELPAALARHGRERLPEYMVPGAFVVLPELPLLSNGKLDRRALPIPEPVQGGLAGRYVAPRGPIEEIVAGIWAEVLGAERVGVEDDFFTQLGGHSLLATQVISRVRERLGIELPLRTVFEAPTVARWAALAEAALAGGEGSEAADTPIARRPEGAELPLSYAQERLWFLEQLMPGTATYNLPVAVRLTGALDRQALAAALTAVVERHEVLRTAYAVAGGRPVQVVEALGAIELPLVDLAGVGGRHGHTDEHGRVRTGTDEEETGVAPARLEAEVALQAGLEAARPFDFGRGPMLRGLLLRRAADDHLLVVTLHHIASDGWSLGVLVGELAELYAGRALPPLPIQYADYALWQRAWLSGEVLARQIEYWRHQLAGVPVLELPFDRPRPVVEGHRGAQLRFPLAPELAAALPAAGRQGGATLFMVLLAAFQAVLARWSGQSDVAVGTAVANRRRRELEGLIGFFVNTLALRTDLAGAPTFRELLARVREVTLGAYGHQDVPFEKLVEELRPARDTSHAPLVQVSFLLQNAPLPTAGAPALALAASTVDTRTSKFDLLVSLSENAAGLSGIWEYNTDLFDAPTIERLAGHFERFLAEAIARPDERVSRLSLLDPRERAQVVAEWNDTAHDWGPLLPLHESFAWRAAEVPDRVALVAGSSSASYGELANRVAALASRLANLGVGPEARVGLCLERGFDLVTSVLSALTAGGAYVPLDPAYPPERLRLMIEDAHPTVVVTRERYRSLVAPAPVLTIEAIRGAGGLGAAPTSEDGAQLSERQRVYEHRPEPSAPPPARAELANAAYVIFTSGSTGRPKGVMMHHGAVANLMAWQAADTPRPARVLQLAPASFDVSFQELFSTLTAGGTLVLIDELVRRDPQELLAILGLERIERLFLPMTALQHLADAWVSGGGGADALRELITAGERLQVTEAVAALCRSTGAALWNQYGPTESHVVTSRGLFGDPAAWPTYPPIGRPLPNTAIYLLDAEGEPVPVGVPGELFIAGVAVARGYLHRPELTAERFVPDPLGQAGARLYKTGDRARWIAAASPGEPGEIEYLGRVDQQVKLRGFRIEPGEIEALLASHPWVKEAAVGIEDAPGGGRLVAWVVPAAGETGEAAAAGLAELRRHCQAVLPGYMVPGAFVVLERFPLLPSGKLDRRSLPAAGSARPELAAPFIAPGSQLERTVAAAWREVLGVERVGIHDNFFDLGGHSLLAVRLHGKLQEKLGQKLSVIDLFRYPTVASFVRSLTGSATPAETQQAQAEKAERLKEGQSRLEQQAAARRAAMQKRRG